MIFPTVSSYGTESAFAAFTRVQLCLTVAKEVATASGKSKLQTRCRAIRAELGVQVSVMLVAPERGPLGLVP